MNNKDNNSESLDLGEKIEDKLSSALEMCERLSSSIADDGEQMTPITNCVDVLLNRKSNIVHVPGQVYLLDFWATWCPPCQDPMQRYQELIVKHRQDWGKKVKIFGLSIDETVSGLKNHIEKKKLKAIDHYHVRTRGCSAQIDYNITEIPHVVLIDKTGKIRYRGHPAARNLEQEINNLLAQKVNLKHVPKTVVVGNEVVLTDFKTAVDPKVHRTDLLQKKAQVSAQQKGKEYAKRIDKPNVAPRQMAQNKFQHAQSSLADLQNEQQRWQRERRRSIDYHEAQRKKNWSPIKLNRPQQPLYDNYDVQHLDQYGSARNIVIKNQTVQFDVEPGFADGPQQRERGTRTKRQGWGNQRNSASPGQGFTEIDQQAIQGLLGHELYEDPQNMYADLLGGSQTHRVQSDRYDQLSNTWQIKDQKVQNLRDQIEAEQTQNFQPKLNKQSQRIFAQRNSQPFFERLDSEIHQRQEKQEMNTLSSFKVQKEQEEKLMYNQQMKWKKQEMAQGRTPEEIASTMEFRRKAVKKENGYHQKLYPHQPQQNQISNLILEKKMKKQLANSKSRGRNSISPELMHSSKVNPLKTVSRMQEVHDQVREQHQRFNEQMFAKKHSFNPQIRSDRPQGTVSPDKWPSSQVKMKSYRMGTTQNTHQKHLEQYNQWMVRKEKEMFQNTQRVDEGQRYQSPAKTWR